MNMFASAEHIRVCVAIACSQHQFCQANGRWLYVRLVCSLLCPRIFLANSVDARALSEGAVLCVCLKARRGASMFWYAQARTPADMSRYWQRPPVYYAPPVYRPVPVRRGPVPVPVPMPPQPYPPPPSYSRPPYHTEPPLPDLPPRRHPPLDDDSDWKFSKLVDPRPDAGERPRVREGSYQVA